MDIFKNLIYEANKAFNTADHLAYVTYPLVNDTKVITLITEHLFNALEKGMDALLYIERLYKRIQQYSDSFEIGCLHHARTGHGKRLVCCYSLTVSILNVCSKGQQFMFPKPDILKNWDFCRTDIGT